MSIPTSESLKKSIEMLSELIKQYPEKTRIKLLREVEIKMDLNPRECEFLDKHFSKTKI